MKKTSLNNEAKGRIKDARRQAETDLRARLNSIEGDDITPYLSAFTSFATTLFDAEAAELVDWSDDSGELKDSLAQATVRIIESILPDRSLQEVLKLRGPDAAQRPLVQEMGSEALYEEDPSGKLVSAREHVQGAQARHGYWERFMPLRIGHWIRSRDKLRVREELSQVLLRQGFYWTGQFATELGAQNASRSNETGEASAAKTIVERPIRVGEAEIKAFVEAAVAVSRDRLSEKYAKKLNRLPDQANRTGNSGAYLPARIKLEKQYLRALILALSNAWREAFKLYGMSFFLLAEKEIRLGAQQMAGGSISAIRHELRLRSTRLLIAEEGRGLPWHLEIEKTMNSAVKVSVLRLRRQQISSKSSHDSIPWTPPDKGTAVIPPPRVSADAKKETTSKPLFPNRALWLKDKLRERFWNKHDLARQRGPDHKTAQKILDGLAVREDVLEKLVTALSASKKAAAVTVLDIPSD